MFTLRSRQHVICTRLNDKEYAIYERLLRKVTRNLGRIDNQSDAFRKALFVINEMLKREAMEYFYEHCLDV